MEVVLGIDLGTSYFKAAVVDKNGILLGLGRAAVPVDRSHEKRWELPTDSFWKVLKTAVDDACTKAGAELPDISAVSYSSQANSFLLLDSDNQPLTPLILWPDTRFLETDPVLDELWSSEDYLQKTGMNFRGPEFCISKVRWFQRNEPALWAVTRRIMTISDYLSFILTGEAIGDSGTASLLGIYNLREMKWWSEALSSLNIPEEFLSIPYRPGTVKGYTASSATEYLGLKSGIPFSLGGLDHHIAALGAGAGQIAETSESTGTVLACYHSPVRYHPDSSSCLGPSVKDGEYYRLKFNNNGGRGIEWYRDTFAKEYSLSELDNLAAVIPAGSDGLLALAEVFKEKDLSRFLRNNENYGHGHYIRAMMESTSVSLLDLLSGLYCGKGDRRILATGGGAQSALWLRIKASVTGMDFITTTSPEPASFGAGMLAAVAAGWYESLREISLEWVSVKNVYCPDKDMYQQYVKWLVQYRQINNIDL